MVHVLIVDDNAAHRDIIANYLGAQGWTVSCATGGEEALRCVAASPPAAVVMDIRMPGMDGRAALRAMRAVVPGLPVVLITAYGEIRDAVDAVKDGAVDYLTKPIDLEELAAVLAEVVEEGEGEERAGGDALPPLPPWLVVESERFRQTVRQIALVAPTEATCLITGESGTGKEVLAELVHRWSRHAQGPLVRVNVAALPKSLVERELFGHVRGAFTGAVGDAIGYLEAAAGGTLFLDEIGELPSEVQVRLLRALETKEFYPVGDSRPRTTDARLVVATNRDLDAAIEAGTFREDLYWRIDVFRVHVAPLRERAEEILPLARSFAAARAGSPVRFSPRAAAALERYPWPGNVRELRNVVDRALILARGDVILPEHLPERIVAAQSQPPPAGVDLLRPLDETERMAIMQALEQCGGNRTRAARILGISRRTLLNRLKEYGRDSPA